MAHLYTILCRGNISGTPVFTMSTSSSPVPGAYVCEVNSPVMRIAYTRDRLLHFRISEHADDGRNEFLGIVTVTPEETAMSSPLVPPEQVINRPEFRSAFAIQGRG
eukprot:Blabericola_migrator_1__2004@NODE_1547_length_4305_cov_162_802029_g1014_i0_p6_GENE_NODE_1547_length_4305_cov_162_802029_g1014_i0NODE_1547_length_4305_cov_162_802029_g1014_i0_p6_ORF_typecomplete_len106_score16_48eIF_4EBP/PF05456_11/0_13_NODE_1547_length_4305_cov_162_802029_g1014_i0551868